jgi:hypothetical protein
MNQIPAAKFTSKWLGRYFAEITFHGDYRITIEEIASNGDTIQIETVTETPERYAFAFECYSTRPEFKLCQPEVAS